jgi:hypothetical protein
MTEETQREEASSQLDDNADKRVDVDAKQHPSWRVWVLPLNIFYKQLHIVSIYFYELKCKLHPIFFSKFDSQFISDMLCI